MAGQSNFVTVSTILQSVRDHKWLGGLVFLLMVGLAVAAWMLLPRKYISDGKLLVQVSRSNSGINSVAEGNSSVSIQDTRETEIQSVIELVNSWDVIAEVVEEIGTERIMADALRIPLIGSLTGSSDAEPIEGLSPEQLAQLENREEAINHLRKNLRVSSEKRNSVISLSCLAASPSLAREIVTLLMQKVQAKHVEVHAASRSRSFFDKEFELQQAAVEKAEENLAEFRSAHDLLSIDSARATHNGVIDKLENQRVDTEVDLWQAQAKIAELQSQVANIAPEVEQPTSGLESDSTEEAKMLLNARIGEKTRLAAKYTDDHPKLAEIRSEIEQLRAEFASLPTGRSETEKVQNPVFEDLSVALALEVSNAESLKKRLDEIRRKMTAANERLDELNRLELQSSILEREVEVAQQYFQTYARKRGDAMVVDQLDKETISDIVVAQPASLIFKKQSPKGSVILPLGVVVGGVCAIGACLVANRRKLFQSLVPREIEDELALPVLVTIPRVHSSRVLSN